MGRRLATSVMVGSTVYEAGTDESKIADADAITASDVWEGGGTATVEVNSVDASEFEKAAKALESANAEVEQLRARVAELEAAAKAAEKGAYDDLDVDALKAEIDKRNEGRDDESKLSKRGGQETLAGVLVADDKAQEH